MGLGVFREGRLRLEGEHTRKRELSWWRKRGVCKVFCRDLGFRSRARKVFLDEAKPRSTFKGSRRINLEILVRFWAFWVSGHRGRWSDDGSVWWRSHRILGFVVAFWKVEEHW